MKIMLTAEENEKKNPNNQAQIKLALQNFRLEIRREILTIISARIWNSPLIRVVPGKKKNKPTFN